MLGRVAKQYLRNMAIIAHVDHGKTTLLDSILKQSGLMAPSMDKLELEKERGITILSKCTSLTYNNHVFNFVDTPGHADFGGQVERIMNIVDGVLLVVCATEGPMPQTRYVLSKALSQKLKPIVVINKMDRSTASPADVENKVFDLFCSLDASEDMMDYPVIYASGREGWVSNAINGEKYDTKYLLDRIINHFPHPLESEEGNFKMLVSMTEANPYFGKFLIGKINNGEIKVGDPLYAVTDKGKSRSVGKVMKIQKNLGQTPVDMESAGAGDIISIAGIDCSVNDTISNNAEIVPIPSLFIDQPTVTLNLSVNDSPFHSTEGSKNTFQTLKDRLFLEATNDVALRVRERSGYMEVSGRGELHLGVLLEQLRREDFEFMVEAPTVVTVKNSEGKDTEPIERVKIEVDSKHSNTITEAFMNRNAEFVDMEELPGNITRLLFKITTRQMMGLKKYLVGLTKGEISMESEITGYEVAEDLTRSRSTGVIIATHNGICTEYGLSHLEEKGVSFVLPGTKVYAGMVVGEVVGESELELNPAKEKRLTNIRSAGRDDNIKLSPPKVFTIEEAFTYIQDDELVEITPKNIRIRKKELNPNLRRRDNKIRKQAGK